MIFQYEIFLIGLHLCREDCLEQRSVVDPGLFVFTSNPELSELPVFPVIKDLYLNSHHNWCLQSLPIICGHVLDKLQCLFQSGFLFVHVVVAGLGSHLHSLPNTFGSAGLSREQTVCWVHHEARHWGTGILLHTSAFTLGRRPTPGLLLT